MKATKRYSKSTTKKAIDTAKDSYLPKGSQKGEAICKGCSAVYQNKRWRMADVSEKKIKRLSVLCPACKKIKDDFPGGYVTLKGDFLKEHKEEILNLVKNKEERARSLNPLERVMAIKSRKGEIEITTTTDKFAQRLGKILNKAFSGTVEYKWSGDTKVARVIWTRQS
ncbi:MAG: BCAM0308 family protein [Deltaproteobacteria bacterium]